MPELPEVETVRAGLAKALEGEPTIKQVKLMRADIRFPIPKELPELLKGQKVIGVRRRAKYLFIDTPKATLLSHLGMTGSRRFRERGATDLHDHCFIEFDDGRELVFRDPRRFGMLDLIRPGLESEHPRLKGLGPEPLDESAFNGEYLYRVSRKRRVPVKAFLMDQKVVVGVGNIYASECLFLSGVKPQKLASRLSRLECDRIAFDVVKVLKEAIAAGGSSIRDYKNASGGSGEFQNSHKVYDRGGDPCTKCGQSIRSKVIGGRSTFWCQNCQK